MVNYVLSSIVLNLMVHNMTGKPFTIFQPTLLLLVLPFAAHYARVGTDLEAMVTVFVTAAGFFIFVGKMTILSMQWCQYSGKPFWYVPKAARQVEQKSK